MFPLLQSPPAAAAAEAVDSSFCSLDSDSTTSHSIYFGSATTTGSQSHSINNSSIGSSVLTNNDSTGSSYYRKRKSPSQDTSLSHKFDQLEKKWNLYTKFGELEKHWSRHRNTSSSAASAEKSIYFNSDATTSTLSANHTNKDGSVIELQDPERKYLHIHEFATQEKELQQGQGQQEEALEARQEEPESDKAAAADGELREKAQHEEETGKEQQQEDEKPRFVFKKRGAKRPKRLFTLTRLRQWNCGTNTSSTAEMNAIVSTNDSEDVCSQALHDEHTSADQESNSNDSVFVDFEKSHTNSSSHRSMSSRDTYESRDEQTFEDLTKRVLLSMPNYDLWDVDENGVHLNQNVIKRFHEQYHEGPQETILFTSSSLVEDEDREGPETTALRGQPQAEREGIEPIAKSREVPISDVNITVDSDCWVGAQLLNACQYRGPDPFLAQGENKGGKDDSLQPVVRDLLHLRLCTVSAVLIQSCVRMKIARLAYQKRLSSHRAKRRRGLLKSVPRINQVRKFQIVERTRKAAVVIQSAFRRWDCQTKLAELRRAAIKVQRHGRIFLGRIEKHYAATKIQHFWIDRKHADREWPFARRRTSSPLSFDGSGISTLSFDNSYLYDDHCGVAPLTHQYPAAVSWDPEDPMITSPLPPRHPSSPKTRHQSAPRARSTTPLPYLLKSPPPCPCPDLPPLAPSLRSRSFSPGRQAGRSRTQTAADILKYKRRQQSPIKGRVVSPPLTPSSRGDRTPDLVSLHESFTTESKKRGLSSLSYVSPKTSTHRFSPLANVVPTSDDDESVLKRRYNSSISGRHTRPTREHSLKRRLSWKEKIRNQRGDDEQVAQDSVVSGADCHAIMLEQTDKDAEESEWKHVHSEATELEVAASVLVQKIWRSYRCKLTLTTMLSRKCTVVCECNQGKISRDRLLRHKAQAMCVKKAISQVGCFGAHEKLRFKEREIVAEWENVIYVNVTLPDGGVANTFATVYATCGVQRLKLLDGISRKKLFMLIIKSALIQNLCDEQQKSSRLSLLERSLVRRRAPAEKEAAIHIESFFRGSFLRQRYLLVKASTVLIQKHVRCRRARAAFQRQKHAAKNVQAFFRGELVRGIVFQYWVAAIALRGFWNDYRQVRMSAADMLATRIQAVFRGSISRNRFLESLYSAAVIQASFRSYAARSRFLLLKHHCIALQTATRQKIAAKAERERQATIFIQRWYRFEQYNNMMKGLCATTIGTSYRRYREERKFRCLRSASLTIQRNVRNFVAQKRRTVASTLISKWYRGISQRNIFEEQRFCAVDIQTEVRRYCAQIKYQQLIWAIVILQFQTRKMIQTRREIERENSVIRIQAAYRGHREIKLYKIMRRSSCLIQAQWRSYCARFQFHIHRGASIFMQRTYRHYLFKRRMSIRLQTFIRGALTRGSFQLRKSSACKIQHWMIGRLGRCAFVRKRDAAIKVQALCRGMWDEACFFLQKVMAVRLENAWRRYLQSTRFVSLRSKTIRVQAITRGSFERQKFCRMREAAVAIQARLRMFQSMKYVQALKTSCTQIQKWWRAIAIRQYLKNQYRQRAISIIKLQSWYRCNIQVYKFVICQFSIIFIQSAWRGYQKRCEYSVRQQAVSKIQAGCRKKLLWNHKLRAIVRLQSLARHLVAKKKQNALLAQKRKADKLLQAKQRRKMKSQQRQSAAIMLQAAFRKYSMKIKNRAITIIQRYFRQQKRRLEWSSCIAIQRSWRGFYGRLLYSKLQERIYFLKQRGDFWMKLKVQSASLIENQWRVTKARSGYKNLRRCVVTIQSLWRAKRARIAFVQARSGLISFQIIARKRCQLRFKGCILIQRNLRMVLARRIYTKWLSLILVQQELKMVLARKSYLKWKSCVLIQRNVRMVSARRRFRQLFATLMHLQNEARIFFDRKVSASIVLQRNWRMLATRKRYMILRSAITTLHQRHCVQVHRHRTRSMAARIIQAKWRSFYHVHACRIQSSFRAYKARRAFRRQRLAAVIMQSWYRCANQRFRLLIKVICATIIQSVHRGRLQRKRIQETRKSAAVVESAWISHKRKKAATHLQASWRSFKAHRSFMKARKGCLLLQAVCRRKLFLLRVQKKWRMRVFQPELKDTRPGVVKLQSLLRGRLERRAYRRTYSMIVAMQARANQRIALRNKSALCLQATLDQQLRHSMTQQACLVQAVWRGALSRVQYRVICHGLALCQRRMKQRWSRKVEASKVLQRQLRMRHSRSMFNQKQSSAIHLQAWVRRAFHKARFCKLQTGMIMLQRLTRRRSALHFVSAVTIQSAARKILARSYCDQVKSNREDLSRQLHHSMTQQACLVQAVWRGVLSRVQYRVICHGLALCQRRMKQRWLRKVEASKVLQRQLRMKHSRSMFNQKQSSAIHLQAWFRGAIHKARFCKIQAGIILLQRLTRRHSALHFVSAVMIQSKARKILARSYCDQVKTQEKASGALKRRNGAVKVQSAYRMRRVQSRYRSLIASANVLQKHWRRRQCLELEALLHKNSRQEVRAEISPYKLKYSSAPIIQGPFRGTLTTRSLPMSGGAFCYGIFLKTNTKSQKPGYPWAVPAQQGQAPVGKVSELVHSRSPAFIKRDQLNFYWKKSILATQKQLENEVLNALSKVKSQKHVCIPPVQRQDRHMPVPQVSELLHSRSPAFMRVAQMEVHRSKFILVTQEQLKSALSSLSNMMRGNDIAPDPHITLQPFQSLIIPEHSNHEQRLVSDTERISLIGQLWESLSELHCQLGNWIILRLQKHPIATLKYLGGALLAILTNKGAVGFMNWASKLKNGSVPSNMDPVIVLAGNERAWCFLDKALDILTHAFSGIEWSLFLRSLMVQDLEKITLLVAFLAFASTAALVGSPYLSTSFLGLGVSVLAQKPNSFCHQEGARSIQTCWRRYHMKKLFAKRKASCVRIQRVSRRRQEIKMRASVKIQRRFRLIVKSRREDIVVSRPCPETKLLISGGPRSSLSKYFVVCWVIMAGTILLKARYARLAVFIMELMGARLIFAQIRRRRQEALEKQERCISRLQHAFRRRQALKKWKADIGVYDHEQQFCAKLQNFERLVEKLKCEVSDEMVEAPKKQIVNCGGQMLEQVWAEFFNEEKAATQIQRWSRKLSPTHEAARLIQHWFRGILLRQAFLKFRRAAMNVQSFLRTTYFAKRKDAMVKNILKELLNRRQKILSAVTLQRWYRGISAMSTLRHLKQKKSIPQRVQFDERSIVAEAIRGYCEDRHCARKAMVEEEEILHPGSNSVIIAFSSGDDDDSIADSIGTDIKFYIAEAENYNENLLVFPICPSESFVRVSETDSGVELEAMTAITEQGSKCCGFEVFLP